MKDLAMAYSMKRMSKGGMKCAHGGPVQCSMGCYAEGGDVAPKSAGPYVDLYHATDDESEEERRKNSAMVVQENGRDMQGYDENDMKKKSVMMSKGGIVEGIMAKKAKAEDYLSAEDEDSSDEVFSRSYPDEGDVEQRDDAEPVLKKIMMGLNRRKRS